MGIGKGDKKFSLSRKTIDDFTKYSYNPLEKQQEFMRKYGPKQVNPFNIERSESYMSPEFEKAMKKRPKFKLADIDKRMLLIAN
jgi:hypothetical protein